MKKHLILTLGVALASPLLMAQSDTTAPTTQKQALPPLPASGSLDKPTVDAPRTTEDGQMSGSANQGGNSVGATGNPNTKSAATRTRGANATDFGSMDANSDGRISQEEIRVNAGLSGGFKKADTNKDGTLSQAEFSKLEQQLKGARDRSAGPTGDDTEGSDRTDKDDEVSKRLPGG
ncbi:MAG TPA: hypothetical protein VM240_12540 [Verrucomicrobiae bacterium]|nr:hypothetical protein [Verrucomicrobiae bacterium]